MFIAAEIMPRTNSRDTMKPTFQKNLKFKWFPLLFFAYINVKHRSGLAALEYSLGNRSLETYIFKDHLSKNQFDHSNSTQNV